jgi:hypothetical protein
VIGRNLHDIKKPAFNTNDRTFNEGGILSSSPRETNPDGTIKDFNPQIKEPNRIEGGKDFNPEIKGENGKEGIQSESNGTAPEKKPEINTDFEREKPNTTSPIQNEKPVINSKPIFSSPVSKPSTSPSKPASTPAKPSVSPSKEIWIPYLCESLSRLRVKAPTPTKILLWDTRQLLLQQDKSPFMKQMFGKLKQRWNDAIDSQALLMAQAQSYLPEGYLDNYTAVIHIPYNISTMSMFQHVRANIPIWVPTKRLLKELWLDPKEPNELSWCNFVPGSESNASTMDTVKRQDVLDKWLEYADFYKADVLPLVYQFDSIEELVEKVITTDYQTAMENAESKQEHSRENILFAWEQVLQGLNE